MDKIEVPKRVTVDEDTRWGCQRCGECCNKRIIQKVFNITVIKEEYPFLEKNNCKLANNKPLICRLYPFFPGVNKGKISFAIGKLTIFAGCPGLGKGKKVAENKGLLEKIDENAKELMERLVLKSQGKIKSVFKEKNEAS